MKHLLFMSAFLVGASFSLHAVIPQSPVPAHKAMGTKVLQKAETGFVSHPIDVMPSDASKRPVLHTSEKMHTVTYKMVYDKDLYESTGMFRVAGEDGFYEGFSTWSNDDPDFGTVELPEGEYTFATEFCIIDNSKMFSNGGYAWIVLENVVVDGDVTVEFAAADAKNLLTMGGVTTPHGETPMLPTTHFSPDGRENLEGNVSELSVINALSSRRHGWLYGRGSKGNFGVINDNGGSGFNIFEVSDVHINDVSDDIYVSSTILMGAADGFYSSTMKTVAGIEDNVEGEFDAEYPTVYEEKYVPSLLASSVEDDKYEHGYTCSFARVFPSGKVSKNDYISVPSPEGILYCAGINNASDFEDNFFNITYADYVEPWIDEETGEEMGYASYFSQSQGLSFDRDGNPIRNFSQLLSEFNTYEYGATGPNTAFHPAFDFAITENGQQNGDSQPTLLIESFREYSWSDEDWLWYVDPLPFGRCGEYRVSDRLTAIVDVKDLDGGGMEYSAIVSNNVIDGLVGCTTAVNRLYPKQDINAPIVQQLQFRSGVDFVTDRFGKGDDLVVRLAVGDYNHRINEEEVWNCWFDHENVDVQFEYSMFGENDWMELPMVEIPEWHTMEFGYLYEGKIDNVASVLDKGWYDVRITLQDAQGSWHQQVVSPAFKVQDTVGVEGVATSSGRIVRTSDKIYAVGEEGAIITVYDMNGRYVAGGKGSVDISGIDGGCLIVKAVFADGVVTAKTVK